MKRRTFLMTPALLPALGSTSRPELRATYLVDEETPVNFIIRSHLSASGAERYRRSWIDRVWEDAHGEWYAMHSESRELPPELAKMPGSLSYHETRFGESGEEQLYLAGAFRREHISCIVRVRDDIEPLMIDIASHIAAQPVPDVFASTWNQTHLQHFIPGEEGLGVKVEPDESFFP